jgi:hypothetical protein
MNTYDFTDVDLFELVMEFNLYIGLLFWPNQCACVRYLLDRKDVLFPEFLRIAHEQNIHPVDVFKRFAKRLHARHG